MKGHLIRIEARDSFARPAPLLVCSVDDRSLCHLDGEQWVPAIARLPQLRYDFFGGDFRGAITTPSASFTLAIDGLDDFTTLRFASARVRIWSGELGAGFGDFTLRFDGLIKGDPAIDAGLATFEAGPDDAWLDKPLLALFAGTGGIEGFDDLEGTVKPLVLGECRFAPGTLIDAVDNVYCLSAAGAIQDVTKTYDRVVSLGASSGDHASLAALLAAGIANGSWATCKALGLVRLGAPADGQVSFDVSGDNAGAPGFARGPGAMIRRIAELKGGRVSVANLAALDVARPWYLAMVLVSQTTARQVIQEIADSVCAVAGISWTGTLFVQPLGLGDASLTLASDGSADPPVEKVTMQPVAAPFWRLATRAQISWVVHDPASVASEYVYRGKYSALRVYRLDDMVDLEDGSSWVYVNATSAAGNAPPTWPTTSNAYWNNLSPPASASDIRYASGVSLESLKPAAAGADVTGANTAANASNVGSQSASTVNSGVTAANAGVNSDGTVKTDKVATAAIQSNGVTVPWFTSSSSGISFASATKTLILSLTVTKQIDDSDLKVNGQVPMYGADAVDVDFAFEAYSGATLMESRTFNLKLDANGSTYLPFSYRKRMTTLPAGTYDINFYGTRTSGNTCQTAGEYDLEVEEVKR